MRSRALAAAAAALLAGCGEGVDEAPPLPPAVRIGSGPAHRPPPLSPAVRSAAPAGRLRCTGAGRQRVGVHLEVFGDRRTVIVPAGIGIAPPWAGRAPYVRSGRCSYPLRTREPTGVIEIVPGARATLGDFFELWGQELTPRRVGAFRGRTQVWVDGRPWAHDPRAVPLRPHAQIVVSDEPRVPVHARYAFPPGL